MYDVHNVNYYEHNSSSHTHQQLKIPHVTSQQTMAPPANGTVDRSIKRNKISPHTTCIHSNAVKMSKRRQS
jgi:hypothetical protein